MYRHAYIYIFTYIYIHINAFTHIHPNDLAPSVTNTNDGFWARQALGPKDCTWGLMSSGRVTP